MTARIIKRIVKGVGAHMYGQMIIIGVQLLGVPILLHFWGVQLYGEWLILFAIPSYLSLTDLGFAQSAANDMTQRMANHDREGALIVFQSIAALIALCSFGGLLVVIVLFTATPLINWLPLHSMSNRDATWVLGLLGAEVLVKLNEGAFHAGFRANNGYGFHVTIYYSTLLVQYIGLWIAAAIGNGPVVGALIFFVVRLLVIPVVAILLVRRYPWLRLGFKNARKYELVRLFRPSLANMCYPLSQGLNIQGMRLAVGAALGPLAVVTFSTLRTLSRLALQGGMIISQPTEPEIAAAYGDRNITLIRNLYVHTSQISLLIVGVTTTSLYFTSEWILNVWTHGEVKIDKLLFACLLASSFIGTLWYNGMTVLKAANRHFRASILLVIAAGLAIVFAYALMSLTGRLFLSGIALLVMDLFTAVYVVTAASKLCSRSAGPILKQILTWPVLLKYER